MQAQLTYTSFYIFSVMSSLFIAAYAWRRRDKIEAAKFFSIGVLVQASWTFGYIFELIATDLSSKLFWDNFQFIGYAFTPVFILMISLYFTKRIPKRPKLWWGLLSIVPASSVILAFTNSSHGLIRSDLELIGATFFPALSYTFEPLMYFTVLYNYVIALIGLGFIVDAFLKTSQNNYRKQLVFFLLGYLIPMVVGIFTLFGWRFLGQRDATPITFTISNVLYLIGLFRFQLLDIVPIARAAVVESTDVGVIVLDTDSIIVDSNPSAQQLSNKKTSIIGRPLIDIFPDWQPYIDAHTPPNTRKLIQLTQSSKVKHYQLVIFTLFDGSTAYGVVIAVRNVTDLIYAQRNLELASSISRQITTILDIDVLLPQIAESIHKAFSLYHVGIFLIDSENKILRYAAGAGEITLNLKPDFAFDIDDMTVYVTQVARTKMRLLAQNPSPAARTLTPELSHAPSELIIPVLIGDNLLGVIDMQALEENRFHSDDIKILENLVEQVAIAVHNSQLFERWQTVQHETEILYRVGQQLNASSTLDDIVQALAMHLDDFNYAICISLFDDTYTSLEPKAACLPHDMTLDIPSIPVPQTEIFSHGNVLHIHDIAQNHNHQLESLRSIMHKNNLKSLIGTALWVENKNLGFLYFTSSELNRFNKQNEDILTNLADTVAATVARIRLFEKQAAIAERLREVDDLKSKFLASMSHELRTPMNSILNFTKIVLMEKLGDLTPRQKDVLQKSVQSGQHLLELINDILDITKIESDMLELYIEDDINLQHELDVVLDTIGVLFTNNEDVQLILDIDEGLPTIIGDRRRIRQILINLLSNAAKFTASGNVTFSVKRKRDETIVFAVIDTGHGIAPSQLETIFEPFVQTETGIQHIAGTGLGLPISRRLAEAHGGQLWVESDLEDGSAFYFKMPVSNPDLIKMFT